MRGDIRRFRPSSPNQRDRDRRYDQPQAQNPASEEGSEIKNHAKQKVHLGTDDPRIAHAIFTLRETAGYLDVPKSNIQRWARPPDAKHPLITCFPAHGREATVPLHRLRRGLCPVELQTGGGAASANPPGRRGA